MRSLALVQLGLATLFAGSALAPAASAQTVMGQVVSLSTNRPLPAVQVALVDDSARIVAATVTDSVLGAFYVDAPHAGRYRVVLYAPGGGSFLAPAVALDTGETTEQLYRMPELSQAFAKEYGPANVTTPATVAVGNAAPRYPANMQQYRTRGSVSVAFVVDAGGTALVDSAQVVFSSDEAFTQSVREALRHMTFNPAELDGRKVRQVMHLTFGFGFPGDNVYGDVVTIAVRVRRLP